MNMTAEKNHLRVNYVTSWSSEAAGERIGQFPCNKLDQPSKNSKRKRSQALVGAMLSPGRDTEDDEILLAEDQVEEDAIAGPSDTCEVQEVNKFQSEVDRYFLLPQIPHTTEDGRDADILSWWKLRSLDFPYLSKMARQFLALPCSSASKFIYLVNGCRLPLCICNSKITFSACDTYRCRATIFCCWKDA